MSFKIVKIENSTHLSKEANEALKKFCSWAIPNKQLFSELPPPLAHMEIKPFTQACDHFLEIILNMDIRSDDVFVCSLAKCGSSWLQTIVWLLKHDLDYGTIQSVLRTKLVGDFEDGENFENVANELMEKDSSLSSITALKKAFCKFHDEMKSPRIIKTHLPVYALPKKIWSNEGKVIYICRNMKDMIVSEYHFWRNFFLVDISMDDCVNGITNDEWIYAPHMDHILNFWNVKHLPNILFITYEDLLSDSFATIKKISKFLERSYTDEQIKDLTEFTSFENMKKNDSLNREHDIIRMEKRYEKKRLDASYT